MPAGHVESHDDAIPLARTWVSLRTNRGWARAKMNKASASQRRL